jgi:hypothetical protein
MPSHTHKHPLSAMARWTLPAALCSVGVMGAWLAPGASAMTGTPAASTPAPKSAVAIHAAARTPGAKAVMAYWTPARLRAAKPASVIIAGTKSKPLPVSDKHPGKPFQVAGGLPNGHAAVAPSTRTITPEAFPYPYPYDSFTPAWALWRTSPYDVNGKLFFTNGGSDFVCSATSVASANGTRNENEIWTAGHCLVNTEANNHVRDSSAVFIPAYNGNLANFDPFGEFVWNGGAETNTAWLNNRDLTEDEAAMTVGTSSTTGRTLGQAVGWAGFMVNQRPSQQFVAFGYPAASPYNGNNLIEDIAATGAQDGAISGANATRPIAIGNPMTGGSSGGAWYVRWETGGTPGMINGHNDYKYSNQPLAMYSPYQDTLSNDIRCLVATSC